MSEVSKAEIRCECAVSYQWEIPYVKRCAHCLGLEAENERLKEDLSLVEESCLALENKVKSLAPHETCACDYDKPGDVCAHHSPTVERLKRELSLANEMRRACVFTVVDTIGGVDYEGFPTSEINYLQRLRILVEKESRLKVAVEALTTLINDVCECAPLTPHAECKYGYAWTAIAAIKEAK